MKDTPKYDAPASETEYQPKSGNAVLRNTLGITEPSEMNDVDFLAKSHVEFILIHPFREGNGRISRLLIDVMAEKAGYGVLDYKLWDEHKEFYIRSIQAGVNGDYQYMTRLIDDILPVD